MSKVIGPFRHDGVAAVLGRGGFVPARATRDAVRPAPPPKRSAPKRGTRDAAARVVAQLQALGRRADAAGAKFGKAADSLDGLAHNAHRIADSRRALGFRSRV